MGDNNTIPASLDNAATKEAQEIYDAYYSLSALYNWNKGSLEMMAKECAIECVNRIIAACAPVARVYYEEVERQIEKI